MSKSRFIRSVKEIIDRQLEEAKKEEAQRREEVSGLFEKRARLRLILRGKVQGVFFRDFAVRAARELGISGFVQNREDGSLEIVAEGFLSTLKNFLSKVKQGPSGSRIDSMDEFWSEFTGEFDSFDRV